MEESKAIVIRDEVRLGSLTITNPRDVIERASEIATALAEVINKRNLFTIIRGKKFVHVEGWTTLAAMLGVTPREVEVRRHDDGAYEAVVELVRNSDGMIIGRASAYVGMDEKDGKGNITWGIRPEYARRSFAITRATGKANRLCYSWIMNLAGFEPTPAEEMIDADFVEVEQTKSKKQPAKKSKPNGNARSWDGAIIKSILNNQLADNAPNACNMLNMSNLPESPTAEQAVLWAKIYRKRREEKLEPAEAANVANQEWEG